MAIDDAKGIVEIDRLRDRLEFSASEFCRRAEVNESWYSRSKRTNASIRTRSLRRLKETLRSMNRDRLPPAAAQPGAGQ